MVEPPPTDEGWYVLHDFRTVDWDAWRAAPERERARAVTEGESFLADCEAAAADEAAGDSAVFAVLGHEADLLFLHFRPSLDALSAIERRYEATGLAAFTDRADSYVSVTEVSGYVSDDYFGDGEVDEGVRRYIEGKLHPEIPDDEYVSVYPMSKRRGEQHNWYDLPFEERAELMAGHGEVGREYAGRISQVIASSVGLDDHEWSVTLFAADPTDVKDIVYEMRFDEASSLYGEFGDFHVGRRFPPSDLGAFLDGATVPTDDADASVPAPDAHAAGSSHGAAGGTGDHPHAGAPGTGDDGAGGAGDAGGHGHDPDGGADGEAATDADGIRGELADLGVYAGQPRGEDVHATVLYSEAPSDEVSEAVAGLRSNFDHYDTHVRTAVYEARGRDRLAVVSVWETASAAETAAGFLADLPGAVERADEASGFGTMGMFYTVKSDHREAFHDTFDEVARTLDGTDGHIETDLMVNREDETDMFIASQWRSRSDAMAFFGSGEFAAVVDWGREVLADRPRHVFLA